MCPVENSLLQVEVIECPAYNFWVHLNYNYSVLFQMMEFYPPHRSISDGNIFVYPDLHSPEAFKFFNWNINVE